jgi:hypothetical protein
MIKKHWNSHYQFEWSQEGKIAVRMWRAIMYLVSKDEWKWAKDIRSFRKREREYIVKIDGSLSQIGFLIFEVNASGETCLGGGVASIVEVGFGKDSSYQNTAELIRAIIGLMAIVKLGKANAGVSLRGDSKTALQWGREE